MKELELFEKVSNQVGLNLKKGEPLAKYSTMNVGGNADFLVMTEIYAASEQADARISGEILLDEVKKYGQRKTGFVSSVEDLAEAILPELEEGDLVLTLGAGNIVLAGEELVGLLAEAK